jgi:hypothetical protein
VNNNHAIPGQDHTAVNQWLSGTFYISHLSSQYSTYHPSNNTGAGYGRPYTDACPTPVPGGLCLDSGLEDAPKSGPIRTYARNLAAYTLDVGSTRAAIQGPCGANRRWVKGCYFGVGVYAYTQSFVSSAYGYQYPLSITESPDGNAYRVTKAMWKAYGMSSCGDGTLTRVYQKIGRPTGEEDQIGTYIFEQDFERGWLVADRSDPSGNVNVSVGTSGYGTLCTVNGLYDWLDLAHEPCYDVTSDGLVDSSDVSMIGKRISTGETYPINPSYPGYDYDDRYDVNRDGETDSSDWMLVARQFAKYWGSLVCR